MDDSSIRPSELGVGLRTHKAEMPSGLRSERTHATLRGVGQAGVCDIGGERQTGLV